MQSIKEHNLKANHNNGAWVNDGKDLYAIYQRTQSESKSQLEGVKHWRCNFCMQSIKEHNLKANHNYMKLQQGENKSVCNLSKNTIWKQITTNIVSLETDPVLYAIYQRTQSESKSQLSCTCNYFIYSVCNLSKNTIWKQITTCLVLLFQAVALYAIYQRTQSESKSQQLPSMFSNRIVCMQSIKEHNLKANHNSVSLGICVATSVCNLSKNTIWKQITTVGGVGLRVYGLYAIYQRTQSESKSQLAFQPPPLRSSVCNLSKNTIWKQITTRQVRFFYVDFLYAIYQRTQSESKSQLDSGNELGQSFCMQSIKEHNLKANHNRKSYKDSIDISVCNLSKNTIWKQITTLCGGANRKNILYAIYQRTQSESKSQLNR